MKLEPPAKDQLRLFILALGGVSIYVGINDLFLDTVNIPRRGQEIFEWLNAAFGTTHSDDYFSMAVRIYFIYYGLFKIEINKNIS